MPQLGGEERHAAVIFVDIIGSTQLVTSRPAAEVVELLNRFFAVIVDEVDKHRGLVNKFEGDAVLAVFGAPVHLDRPEDEALAAARGMADRLASRCPSARRGSASRPARWSQATSAPRTDSSTRSSASRSTRPRGCASWPRTSRRQLLASSNTVDAASEGERARWTFGDTVTLRGHDEPTQLATLA